MAFFILTIVYLPYFSNFLQQILIKYHATPIGGQAPLMVYLTNYLSPTPHLLNLTPHLPTD
ncbi:unnamed protein product, partial [Sphenostylis stenocarpa]